MSNTTGQILLGVFLLLAIVGAFWLFTKLDDIDYRD